MLAYNWDPENSVTWSSRVSAIQRLLLSIEVKGLSEFSVISRVSAFQVCPLSGVPLYCSEPYNRIESYYGITLWAYLSQKHKPIALHCMHYGITLWEYPSEPLVKDSHKSLSSTEKPLNTACSKLRDHTLSLRTCYGEVYGNIAGKENG